MRTPREGLHRQFLFGGLRIGLYEPVKKLFMGERPAGDAPLYLKIAAGLTTGALAIMVANPTDLVKARPLRCAGHVPAEVHALALTPSEPRCLPFAPLHC